MDKQEITNHTLDKQNNICNNRVMNRTFIEVPKFTEKWFALGLDMKKAFRAVVAVLREE